MMAFVVFMFFTLIYVYATFASVHVYEILAGKDEQLWT